MAHEHTDPNELKADFAAKWRGLKSEADRNDVREFLAELMAEADEGFDYPVPPPMPPEGDPSYSVAVHGPRSEEHLRQIVAQRRATRHLARPMTDEDFEDIERRVQARVEAARRPAP